MNAHALEALEFPRIRELLVARAASAVGRERAHALVPLGDLTQLRAALDVLSEVHAMRLQHPGWQPVAFPDVRGALVQARVAGSLLEARPLHEIAQLLRTAAAVARLFAEPAARVRSPQLTRIAQALFADLEFAQQVERACEPTGEVRDGASAQLRRIRHDLLRLQQQTSARLEQLSREVRGSGEDSIVTLRAGRYVLSVAAGERRLARGIVHDRSATGKTLYVEPLEIVEQNNAIAELQAEERHEVIRILRELTAWVRQHTSELEATVAALGRIDELDARARLALDLRCSRPAVDESGEMLRLVGGRHPLLYVAIGGRLVPLDLTLERTLRGLVVSGPNMGGKTVVLKTVGLLVLMALSGLFVPAGEGTVVPWVDEIFVDIGDEQSLDSELSTYAARLRNMRAMLTTATRHSLVLVDELGAGTDPEEGAALGRAFLDHIGRQGAFCIVCTHHGAFKSFAAEAPGLDNAAVEYDAVTLRPTYRLRVGLPGRSHAFELARREGWPPDALTRAQGWLSQASIQAEGLLEKIEAQRLALEGREGVLREAQAATQGEQEKLRSLSASLRAKVETLQRERALEEDRRLRELGALLREARERIESMTVAESAVEVSELRQWLHGQERRVAALKQTRRRIRRPQRPDVGPRLAVHEIVPGRRAYSRSLGVDVQILELSPGERNVRVGYRSLRIEVPVDDLRALREGGEAEDRTPAAAGSQVFLEAQSRAQDAIPCEVDLRGLTADECRTRLDTYLDRALLAGIPRVRIIHGKGGGILRRAVQELLKAHPHVREFRDGEGPEGGWGVTIALLGPASRSGESGADSRGDG